MLGDEFFWGISLIGVVGKLSLMLVAALSGVWCLLYDMAQYIKEKNTKRPPVDYQEDPEPELDWGYGPEEDHVFAE